AALAGLEAVAFVPEPVAGVVAHGFGRPANRRIAVCDFGGGTFDATLMQQRGIRFNGVASCGDPFLAGAGLGLAPADAIAAPIYGGSKASLRRDVCVWPQLRWRAESAKRQLSTAPRARVHLRDAYVAGERRHDVDLIVDRESAEARW